MKSSRSDWMEGVIAAERCMNEYIGSLVSDYHVRAITVKHMKEALASVREEVEYMHRYKTEAFIDGYSDYLWNYEYRNVTNA